VLTEHSVAEAAAAAGLLVHTRYVESTGSTNDDLMAGGDAGAPAWTVLVAGHQTAGRGRMSRSWEAPPGSSLLVSVLLRPTIEPSRALVLSHFAAIVMAHAIEDNTEVLVACGWPNDLLTRDGRKLGGLLLESRVESGRLLHVVVGLGLNLTQSADEFPPDLRRPATSLTMEGATNLRPELVLRSYLYRLRYRLALGRPGFIEWVTNNFRRRCLTTTMGRNVRATAVDGAVVEGIATGIGESGELTVATSGGEARIASGELEYLD
jgi:BirA family biotin operon repressor/biotin-[acetyl-CoA-carboxylase] ligase